MTMARHKRDQNAEQATATEPLATEQEITDANDAQNAAQAYAQAEIERTNENARAADERALDANGKPKETKAERFKRLAQKRVTKALTVLGHVHNLTNGNSYSYTPEQAQRIVDALVLAVNKIADGFSGNKNGKVTFTL